MDYDYELIESVNDSEFEKFRISEEILERDYARSDDADLHRIERLLGLEDGALRPRGPYYLKIEDCRTCGKALQVSDFVLTALNDAGHPREFVAQVLLGDKKIAQKPRHVRCSSCGTLSSGRAQYFMGGYACDDQKA